MSRNLEKKDNTSGIRVSSLLKELFFMVIGALIGVLANQIFFKENKDYEMKVELKRDLLKEQYQYLNRILQFTRKYELTTTIYTLIITTVEQGTNKVISKDTIIPSNGNFKQLLLPSFIVNEEKKVQFLSDIKFIKSNKDKIDFDVYSKFEELLGIIKENPIPKNSNENNLTKSTWNRPAIQQKWRKTTAELYYLTYDRLY